MSTQKTNRTWIAVVITAIAASLCCITPLLATLAGIGGIASAFSWLEPFRPYLIGITVLVLGFAWYQKLKPRNKEEMECACEEDEKPSFLQSKMFLGIVTVFAALMLTFPYYSHIFYPKTESNIIVGDANNVKKAFFEIKDMTCQSCEEHVKHEVNKLNGIINTEVSYENGTALIEFDSTRSTIKEIVDAINLTGYKVTLSKIKR